jgi:hypothetical protein
MNKEISSNNYQDRSHNEGQQQNIAGDRQNKGINNPPTHGDQQESRQTREAESERTKKKENPKRRDNRNIL